MNELRDFRGPLPLNEQDFAQVRARVLARTERKRYGWVVALAAALLIAVLGVLVWPRAENVTMTAQRATPHPRFADPLPAPRGEGLPLPTPSPRVSGERVAAGRVRGHARHHKPPHTHPPHIAVRLELQTADPDVRIIWIE